MVLVGASLFLLVVFSNVFSSPIPSNETKAQPPVLFTTALERWLVNALIRFRDIMIAGDESLGIPILDPYIHGRQDINMDIPQLKLSGYVQYLELKGLSNYTMSNVTASLVPPRLTLGFSFPGISIKSQYNFEGKILAPVELPLYGKGDLISSVSELELELTVELGLTNQGRIRLQELDVFWNATDVKIRLDGLYGGQELGQTINAILADMLPKVLQTYRENVTSTAMDFIRKSLDEYVRNLHVDSTEEVLQQFIKAPTLPK